MPTLFPTECKIFPAANETLDFAFNTLKSKIGLLCPLVQFGGGSNSAEWLAPPGEVYGVASLERNSAKSSCGRRHGTPSRAPKGKPAFCEIDLDVDVQPGDDPQKGQCGNCPSNQRARTVRMVAIECGLWRTPVETAPVPAARRLSSSPPRTAHSRESWDRPIE